jgi:hypothetical protein
MHAARRTHGPELVQNPTAAERKTLQRLMAEEEAKEGTAPQTDKKPAERPPGAPHSTHSGHARRPTGGQDATTSARKRRRNPVLIPAKPVDRLR